MNSGDLVKWYVRMKSLVLMLLVCARYIALADAYMDGLLMVYAYTLTSFDMFDGT